MPSLRPAFIFCSLLGSAFAAGDHAVAENALMEGRAAIAARGNETIGILPQPRDAAAPAPSASAPAISYLPAPGSTVSAPQDNTPGLVASHLETAPQVGGIALDEPALVPDAGTALVIEAVPASAASAFAAETRESASAKEPSTAAAPVVALADPVSVAPQPAVPSAPPGWIEPALPPSDLLTIPGQDGVITLGVEPISADRAQNPFDVRYVAAGVTSDLVLDLRSLVLRVGPESQDRSVAFLNGRPLMRGDRVGGLFTLASIRLREVILERAGKFYLIPTGRITTVRLAN